MPEKQLRRMNAHYALIQGLFWGGYALALLCGWGVSAGIARLIRAWKQSRETKRQ